MQRLAERRRPKWAEAVGTPRGGDIVYSAWEHAAALRGGTGLTTLCEYKVYGGRSGTANEVRYYEFFREKYRSITETQESWISEVLRSKELRTEWGLKYYWPDTKMERSGYVKNSTSICNYPVQAFATAEIIPVGLVYMWHYVKAAEMQLLLVNTIHDSVIAELPPEEVDDFHVLAKLSLVDEVYEYLETVYGIKLVVPLGAGVMIGKNWSDAEAKASEVTYTAEEGMYGTIECGEA